MLSPPLHPLRLRGGGGGNPRFRARRTRSGRAYEHDGLDLGGSPGDTVYSPVDGRVVRQITCYRGDVYLGLELVTPAHLHVDLLYLLPLPGIVEAGAQVAAGEPVGILQDVSRRYPPAPGAEPMEAHTHVRVWMRWSDPEPEELEEVPCIHKSHAAYGWMIRCYDPAAFLELTPGS